jgi:hypothetical protein
METYTHTRINAHQRTKDPSALGRQESGYAVGVRAMIGGLNGPVRLDQNYAVE